MYTAILYSLFRWYGEASHVSEAKTAVVQVIAKCMPQHGKSKVYRHVRAFNQPFKVLENVLQQIFGAQILSWNKDRKLSSQVVISAAFVLSLSALHIRSRVCPCCCGKNVISALGTNTQGNCYFALEHTQELSILN